MLTLRLTQHAESQSDRYRIEIALEGDGPRQTATASFAFRLTAQDQENLRWYLEDYLQYPHDPAPQIAARVEGRLAEIGVDLFRKIFQANDDARDLWATLRQHLADTCVEVQTGVAEAAAIPWELLRDPKTDVPLALRAKAFVRAYSQAAQRPQVLAMGSGAIRILLVICRPDTRNDVPFRSVASRLIKGLADAEEFQLDVLRPPTFEQLSRVLRQAKASGQPYHVVHFDGHGTYQEGTQTYKEANPLVFFDHRPGKHGYLVFEKEAVENNIELVNGTELGKLLVETKVPVLVLNACRSAYAEAPEAPTQVDEATADSTEADPHSQVRAFGSLAQEVMDAGVAGVLAMRYNVYVMTAAQFVADFYSALTQGQPLGEAVTMGRKQLHAQPRREIIYQPIELQDWLVPIVYEAQPIALFSKPAKPTTSLLKISLDKPMPERGTFDRQFPPQLDVGFFGRDETLLALDRAFDSQSIALLHAYAGSGKTATAAEFGRWYSLTGGVEGPVLFTSFEQYLPLSRVLDKIGQVFGGMLEQAGVHWLALEDKQRRQVALQLLQQIPVLWIWDNIETVAGFANGENQRWSQEEKQELVDFLRVARGKKAKFLLTSRRDEHNWLGDLPVRISVPPMPMSERVLFAKALAEKYNRRLTGSDLKNWQPLLKYTQGNPLTITVVVGQALRRGMKTRDQIETFVTELQSGEADLEDDESEGRSKSLGASLSYGFTQNFNEQERKQLSLLYFFQGYVNILVLLLIGECDAEGNLPDDIKDGFNYDDYSMWVNLLDRAAEGGLLTKLGNVSYIIHPALPWYFKNLFEQYYPKTPQREVEGSISPEQVTRSFINSLNSWWSAFFEKSQGQGVLGILIAEEANLLHAYRIAQAHSWWTKLTVTMMNLLNLYSFESRYIEFSRLLEEAAPHFIDPITEDPLPGKENCWCDILRMRIRLVRQTLNWSQAESLAHKIVEHLHKLTTPVLETSSSSLNYEQQRLIYHLVTTLQELGFVQAQQGKADCIKTHEESILLSQLIGDTSLEAVSAGNLADAYKNIPVIRNLDTAEHWYRKTLGLLSKHDCWKRGQILIHLGHIARERLKEALYSGQPREELLILHQTASDLYQEGLRELPSEAIRDRGIAYGGLGSIYGLASAVDVASQYYQEAIRCLEAVGDFYTASLSRFNYAVDLTHAGRLEEALLYAQAALRKYEVYGNQASANIQETQQLIQRIEQALAERGNDL